MESDRIKELIRKYNVGTLSSDEKALLDAWYLQLSKNEKVEVNEQDLQDRLDTVWNELEINKKIKSRKRRMGIVRYAAAAAIVFMGLIAGLYFYQGGSIPGNEYGAPTAHDILPGGNRATLALADGSTIILDQAGNGELAEQGGTRVIKLNGGLLAYESGGQSETISYNTLSTPRGGQYRVILPDGTKVWLNAFSSLRYPARFTGKERRVTLTGEGYFEVAPARGTPFFVTTATMEAEVVGTHFNINAYEDEGAAKATLLEGSLLVSSGSFQSGTENRRTKGKKPETGNKKLLRPGQEAILGDMGAITVRDADTEMAVAWKNGLFKFRRASVETVMRQLARWYDVEVVYHGKIPEKVFTGEIYRNLNASQVLGILSYTGLDFRIEGKKIIVTD